MPINILMPALSPTMTPPGNTNCGIDWKPPAEMARAP